MFPEKRGLVWTLLLTPGLLQAAPGPDFLEDRFELPAGYRIYRAAGPELCGGSYDIAFDGEGRLLVGDGEAVRRLADRDGDGVYDEHEIIARGLGGRGPQGLLVWGDRLYAVGGDGLQLFEGYRSGGPLVHRGRLGNSFRTGGDHDAHTVLRGWDDHLYFITGNSGGATDRLHITEENSPVLFEREASVFRISPDGRRWECVGAGGRNPPNLGLNRLGELFSLDSDMEWHVGLPWWRPVRLNHWVVGGDQGWQNVGAHPPYFIDSLPDVLDVGRGSPNWGVFYEHDQLPEPFRGAFLVCDYRWKSPGRGGYQTPGRLLAFQLQRRGSGWEAEMEVLARPRPGARDRVGRPIQFALVDIDVAPDGSVFVSDHNQGVWRVVKSDHVSHGLALPPKGRLEKPLPAATADRVEEALAWPQPAAEWSRLRLERLREGRGEAFDAELQRVAGDPRRPAKDRLNAIRLLAANAPRLPEAFLMDLAGDSLAEVRSQAAWLAGLRPAVTLAPVLGRLLEDEDPFVRRRAAESLTRATSGEVIAPLVARLNDPDRLVRYVAMVALSHHRTGEWIEAALRAASPQARMRALVAAHLRREPVADDRAATVMSSLLGEELVSAEDQLDRLRLLGLVRSGLESRPELKSRVSSFLLDRFPSPHAPVRFEQARLLGEYRVEAAFGRLLAALEAEPDPVVQFHLAQALGRLPRGWTEAEQARLVKWLHRTQAGWFADLGDKGFEFPAFWNTVLESLVAHHAPALTRDLAPIDFGSALGGALMDALAAVPEKAGQLMAIYRANTNAMVQRRALLALGRSGGERAQRFLLTEYHRLSSAGANDAALASAILRGWAEKPDAVTMPFLVHEGLFHDDAEVVRAAAAAVVRAPALARRVLAEGEGPVGREPQALLAEELMTEMMRRPQLFRAYDQVLAVGAGLKREQGADRGRLDDAARQAGLQFWRDWFRQQFKREFQPVAESEPGRSDEALHRFLLSDAVRGGDAQRGRRVYEKAQCHTCHGGAGETRAALFGPDLAGVTRRLSRAEVADSLVYPSKQVAERFKAVEIELQDGEVLSGFVTEQTGEHVVLAERERVRRIPRGSIKAQRPQAASLMPAGLLAGLDWEEIRDLVAFLEEGQPPPAR